MPRRAALVFYFGEIFRLGRKYGLDLKLSTEAELKARFALGKRRGAIHCTNWIRNGPESRTRKEGRRHYSVLCQYYWFVYLFEAPNNQSCRPKRESHWHWPSRGLYADTLLRYVLKNRLSLDPTRDVKIVPLGEPPNILPALEKRRRRCRHPRNTGKVDGKKDGISRIGGF